MTLPACEAVDQLERSVTLRCRFDGQRAKAEEIENRSCLKLEVVGCYVSFLFVSSDCVDSVLISWGDTGGSAQGDTDPG